MLAFVVGREMAHSQGGFDPAAEGLNERNDRTQMEVRVNIDEADVGKVEETQLGTFSVDAFPDRRFQARIRKLAYGVVGNTQ